MFILVSIIFTFFCFYFTFFLLLRSPWDMFYTLLSQLKFISLIKLASILNILYPLERNFFHSEKGWNESQRQCTKSAQKVHRKVHKKFFYCADIYVCDNFVSLFHFFGIWLSVKYKDFVIIKNYFQILHVLSYFIKTN